MNYIMKMNKKVLAAILIFLILIIALFIWYNEEGTNNEVPKKATYVMETTKGSWYYKQGTSIHKP